MEIGVWDQMGYRVAEGNRFKKMEWQAEVYPEIQMTLKLDLKNKLAE